MRRFELEARSASALNHPAILTVHDFGVEDGMTYLVTELLSGRTLREVLLAEGPVPEVRALDWVTQIAHHCLLGSFVACWLRDSRDGSSYKDAACLSFSRLTRRFSGLGS